MFSTVVCSSFGAFAPSFSAFALPFIATVEVPIEVFCTEFGPTGASYAVLEVIEFELDPASDKG